MAGGLAKGALKTLTNILDIAPKKTVKKGKGKSGDVVEYILTDKQKDS